MSLLREIQSSLVDGKEIAPILLKLRLLASRLGSNVLEEWVKHESEGYPSNADVPTYRHVGVSYIGQFSGPFGSGIRNAPIPPFLIEKFAGERWTNYEIRQGVGSIEDVSSGKESGTVQIEAANLILLLQGKIYSGYACNSITGQIGRASLVDLLNAIRARVLELTIQLEKSIPAASEISIGAASNKPDVKDTERVTQITHQVVHGNLTNISNSGAGAQFNLSINSNDIASVVAALEEAGIAKADAAVIADIFASEQPESIAEPFGKKAKAWIATNLIKATNGIWKVGVAVATQILTQAAKKYYGLE
jgi:hypothetical protein